MEFVLVVPRARLFPECTPHGFRPLADDDGDSGALSLSGLREVIRDAGYFVERAHAERSPELQQIIPYTVCRAGERVLRLRRLSQGGERRLHDKLSIGVGGHINPEDIEGTSDRADVLLRAAERELHEEIAIGSDYRIQPVGFLNDDTNPVGAVHVGLVQVLTTSEEFDVREHDILEGEWVKPQELARQRDAGADFETWSSFLIDHLDALFEALPSPSLART